MKDISNFDTDNWTFRKDLKQQIKLLTLRLGRSYADALNSPHRCDTNISDIYFDFIIVEESSFSKIAASPPQTCTNSAHTLDHSSTIQGKSDTLISTEDKKILYLFEELDNSNDMEGRSSKSRLTGYLYSGTVFNTSKRVLIEVET